MYEVNAEAARLEQALAHQRDSQRRVENQLRAVQEERSQGDREDVQLREALTAQQEALRGARALLEERRTEHESLGAALPEAEAEAARTRSEVEDAQQAAARTEQAIQVETTRHEHAQRILAQLEQRRQRLENEQAELERAKPEGLEQVERELSDLQYQYDTKRERLSAVEEALPESETTHRAAAEAADTRARELGAVDARCTALELLQRQVSRSGEMHAWLDDHQLDGFGRLWQGLRVEPGWEDALEAVLRERLNGIAIDDLQRAAGWLHQPPPGKVSFFQKGEGSDVSGRARRAQAVAELDQLRGSRRGDGALRLARSRICRARCDRGLRGAREPARRCVARLSAGPRFTRNSASFHAADSEVHGILARQREIEELRRKHAQLEQEANQLRTSATAAQGALQQRRDEALELRGEAEDLQQQCHDLQLDHVRLSEQAERALQRTSQIERELEEIDGRVRA